MKAKKDILKQISLILVLTQCIGCSENVTITEKLETGLFEKIIEHDNIKRDYLLYVPNNYSDAEKLPLVFSLHGAGGTKESQYDLSQFNLLADRENFLLVTPQAKSLVGNNLTFWNQQSAPNLPDDVGFINAIIDEISTIYRVDLNRVYIAGSSNGAFMALEVTCQLNHRIAATAAVKGYMSPEQITKCNPEKATPIIQIHGTDDPLVPYDGVFSTLQYWTKINLTDLQPELYELPDDNPTNGNTVVRHLYKNGAEGVEVIHLEVIGGKHDWFGEPGSNYDINASELIWEFFNEFDINGKRQK